MLAQDDFSVTAHLVGDLLQGDFCFRVFSPSTGEFEHGQQFIAVAWVDVEKGGPHGFLLALLLCLCLGKGKKL